MQHGLKDGPAVTILGAGIAGLTLAAALRRSGLRTTLVEQSSAFNTVGAGLQLSPNSARLLDRLGVLPALLKRGIAPTAIELRRWSDDKLLQRTPLGDACTQRFGAPYLCVTRQDLHDVLHSAVGDIDIRLGRRCIELQETPDTVLLRFDDGSTEQSEFVVGADGIRSTARTLLGESDAEFTGVVAYRALVAAPAEFDRVTIWLGPGQHIVAYPVGDGRVNLSAAVRSSKTTESWRETSTPDELRTAHDHWCDRVQELVAATETVTRWALHEQRPVQRWHTDRVGLVGDAAHPMVPFGAQGAAQAIEDAYTLGLLVADAGGVPTQEVWQSYQALRSPRREEVLAFVRRNAANHHLDDQDAADRDARLDDHYGLERQAWLYGFDAHAAVRARSSAVAS